MNKEKILKVRKSVELCNRPADDDVCEQCPYQEDNDKLYSCIDKRYKDLIEILDWGVLVMETLKGFLKGEG